MSSLIFVAASFFFLVAKKEKMVKKMKVINPLGWKHTPVPLPHGGPRAMTSKRWKHIALFRGSPERDRNAMDDTRDARQQRYARPRNPRPNSDLLHPTPPKPKPPIFCCLVLQPKSSSSSTEAAWRAGAAVRSVASEEGPRISACAYRRRGLRLPGLPHLSTVLFFRPD
jgi:hypothetical protein